MKACLLFVLFIFTLNTFSQNVSPEFSELKGMEDQSGNTHLFYRIYTTSYDSVSYWQISSDNIYHFDLSAQEDSLFLQSYANYYEDFVVFDLAFWQSNPIYYIYGGATQLMILNEQTFIQRFDSENTYDKGGLVHLIEISNQNDSLLYARVNVFDYSGFIGTIRSTDGGWNWERLPDIFEILSLNPSDDQIFLSRDEITKKLYRTTNGGSSYNLVDTSMTYQEQQYHNDQNENHIYRVARNFFTRDYELKVSSNGGEVFSWSTTYTSPTQIFISNNKSVTGEVYLADSKNIYLSTNYGDNFTLYKSLGKNIVGIYKKPNSNKLYAATKYKIYEITPDTIQVIKSLLIPDEVLNYYPLAVGNKWIYDYLDLPSDPGYGGSYGTYIKEVISDSIAANGKHYYLIYDETLWEDYALERIDSTEGKVFRYLKDPNLPENEYVIDDLLAEVGDTVNSQRMGYWSESYTTVLDEVTFEKWGLNKPKKVYEQYILHPPVYSLTQDVGLDSIYKYYDFGDIWIVLKGCIINGVVYGDTTVVSVENETPNLPTEFSLSQNYPNPFNPSTKISWQSPVGGWQTLKVYDVLGNEIAILVNEELPAGEYEVEFNPASSVRYPASGIYFYQLKAGSFIQTKKMILIK